MLYADLSELPEVLDRHPAWSSRRPALAWLRRADHFGDPERPLSDCVRELVLERTGRRPTGAVRLLTHPRTLGFVFNPVSFFYCFDESGDRVDAIVAEVDNTPWGERHLYVLPREHATVRDERLAFDFDKQFHVSPFQPMKQRYAWRFSTPGPRLWVHMENLERGERRFDATLTMERTPLTRESMSRVLRGHPLMTAKVFGAIYWNALRLVLEGAPFFDHPAGGRPRPKTTVGGSDAPPLPPIPEETRP